MKTKNAHNEKYQTIALLTAVAANEYWSINDINLLRALKRDKVSNLEIAQALGRSYYAVSTKFMLVGMDGDVSVMFGNRSRNSAPVSYGDPCSECFIFHKGACR